MSKTIDWLKTVKPKYKKGKASVKIKGVPSSSKGLTFKQRLAQAKKRLKTTRANAPKVNPTRKEIMAKPEEKTNKPAWGSVRWGIIENRAKYKMKTDKWKDIPEGELGDRGKKGKLIGRTRQQGGAKGFTSGQKRVYEKTKRPFWRDFYTNEVITNPDNIEIDHLIPITEMRKRGVLLNQRKQELFGQFIKNLVITKGGPEGSNQKKGGSPLGKFQAEHNPERYSRRYHEVLKDFGGVMSHGERRQYKKDTGEEPTIASQHVRDAQRGEHVSETQYRHDAVKKRMKAKTAQK